MRSAARRNFRFLCTAALVLAGSQGLAGCASSGYERFGLLPNAGFPGPMPGSDTPTYQKYLATRALP